MPRFGHGLAAVSFATQAIGNALFTMQDKGEDQGHLAPSLYLPSVFTRGSIADR